MRYFGAVCDRCNAPYLAPRFPHHTCPNCHLATLSPSDRAHLLGHIAATGRHV